VSGPKDATLRETLTKSRWLMVTDVRAVFYQNAPE